MLGAIIGDIAGSRFEWHNIKSKEFDLLTYRCQPTDDSIMSLAVAKALMTCNADYSDLDRCAIACMQELGRKYPNCGFGGHFRQWVADNNPKPYNSYGNGSAMRVSAVGHVAKDIQDAQILSFKVSAVSHNHPEGLKGAEAVAVAIVLARSGKSMLEIRDYIDKNYYPMDFTLDSIRDEYDFDVSCQGSVPQAFMAFFESTNFEDAVRNAISIGGDSDTIAAITGSIAEAYYGIPADIRKHAITYLDETLLKILVDFENKYPSKIEVITDNVSVDLKTKVKPEIKTGERTTMVESAVKATNKEIRDAKKQERETTAQELYSHIFEGCNILRGPIFQDEYKIYMTPLLFYKRLSDVYDEETQDALEKSGGDEEFAAFEENHSFVIPDGCHWNDLREKTKDVGSAIVNAMTEIEKANPDTLGGIFSSFDNADWTDKTKLSDEVLKDLIEHMSEKKLGNKNYSADIMGDSYEYLLKKFADLTKKNAGQFYTPRMIVRMLVMLLDPKPGDTIYDPACGTGGMLIEAAKYMKHDWKTLGALYGQENILDTAAIARMNLFLHGARDFQIVKGDTLRDPKFTQGDRLKTFDHVLANPPFGLERWGSDQFESDKYGRNFWGTPTDSSADMAWLQHMIKSMDPEHGKCAVILAQGILFHGGTEGKIRERLIESDKLECVIMLPAGVFFNTGVSACVLLMNNNKTTSHKGRICIIDASEMCVAERAKKIMTEENIAEIISLYAGYTDVLQKSAIVDIQLVRKNGYELIAGKYIERHHEEDVPLYKIKSDYDSAVEAMFASENAFINLLEKGGYIGE